MSDNSQQHLKTSKAFSYVPNIAAIGISSGSTSPGGTSLGANPGVSATKRADKAIDGLLYPSTGDYYFIDAVSGKKPSFEIDLRNPSIFNARLNENMVSAHTDPSDTFSIASNTPAGNMLVDNNLWTRFQTAIAGEKAGFEIDLTSEYPDGLEIVKFDLRLGFNSTGDPWTYDWHIDYSTNGTDFFNTRGDGGTYDFSSGAPADSVTSTTFTLPLEFTPDYKSYGGDVTQQGKLPKIKKLRFYIDGDDITGGDQVALNIEYLNLHGVNFDYPDGVYFKQFTAQVGDNASLSSAANFRFLIAYDDETDFEFQSNLQKSINVTTPMVFSNDNYFDDIANGKKAKKVRISSLISTDDIYVYEVVSVEVDNPENKTTTPVDFDFNDTVLTTKGWNSSRYDGKQLSAAKINEFTEGDITYGKSPVVERYTRNIYIGNDVINLNEGPTGKAQEDDSLLPFNGFSYVQTNYYITVNEDGSITHNRLKETTGDSSISIAKKTGFYQSFFDDFPTDKGCRLVIYDPTKKNNLKPLYPIYFNQGQLQPFIRYSQDNNAFHSPPYPYDDGLFAHHLDMRYFKNGRDGFPNDVITWQYRFLALENDDPTPSTSGLFAYTEVENEDIIREFFPGGIDRIVGAIGAYVTQADNQVEIYKKAFEYKNNSNYKGDKRFYLSFTPSASMSPIRTISTGSVPFEGEPLRSANLTELSTVEIISASVSGANYILSEDSSNVLPSSDAKNLRWHIHTEANNLNQNYILGINQPGLDFSIFGSGFYQTYDPAFGITDFTTRTPQVVKNGGIVISKATDNVPSLLVPLNKDVELPQGVGNRPFIIIPENLHPYVEDNLAFYLSKAGINVSEDASELIEEIKTKKRRRPRLSPAQRRALARRQALAREQWMNQDSEKERRKAERKNRRKKRKENRQERREDRRENRQNRREDRRENRQNRKENRQEKRQGRKNRRKNRRKNK